MCIRDSAGDSHPKLRDNIEYTKQYAQEIANSVDKLLQSKLQPITSPPAGKTKWIRLPFSQVPTVQELIEQTKDKTIKGYYARLALERVIRGESLPTELDYLVQTWSFGDEMAVSYTHLLLIAFIFSFRLPIKSPI